MIGALFILAIVVGIVLAIVCGNKQRGQPGNIIHPNTGQQGMNILFTLNIQTDRPETTTSCRSGVLLKVLQPIRMY